MRKQAADAETKFKARNSKFESTSRDQNSNVPKKSRAKASVHAAVLLLAIAISLSACAGTSASSRFYVLSPLPQQKMHGTEKSIVGVLPITWPDYLDRPQIVTRIGEHEITFHEFHRWAEPLRENFYTVLVENLSALLDSVKVVKSDHDLGFQAAFQMGVEVLTFDGDLGGEVTLIAKWDLFQEEDKKLLLSKRSRIKEPTGGSGYDAFVAAQSRAVAALSREIASVLQPYLQR